MIIQCVKCSTKYKLNDNAIQKPMFKAKCVKCESVFTVRIPKQEFKAMHAPKPKAIEGLEHSAGNSDCKVITVCNQKGGVAKTTTCLNLGTSLAAMNKRVLLIDFDVQSSLSLLLGYKDCKSFFELIESDGDNLSNYILKTRMNFWLLPSNNKMSLLSKNHLKDQNFHYMLRDKIKVIKNHFDYVIIDTPPSGDFYTLNALLASNMAVIPAQCEYLSMNGVNYVENMIKVIKKKANHTIDYKMLVVMYDSANTSASVIYNKLKSQHGAHMFNTMIEKDEKVQESQIVLTPTLTYDNNSSAGLQYAELAKEIVASDVVAKNAA